MLSQKHIAVSAAAGLAVGVVAVALFAQSGSSSRTGLQAGALAAARSSGAQAIRPQLTRLQVDVFELRCGADQLLRLDLMEIGTGQGGPMRASSEEILDRLRQLGATRLAVRYDNFVDVVSGTRLASGLSVPTVREIATAGTGLVVPSVQYKDIGFVVSVKGNWLEETEPNLAFIDFDVESSELAEQRLDVANMGEGGLKLPVYQQFKSSQQVVARQGLPVLLACNDLSKRPEGAEQAVVLVARLVATRLIE